MNFTQNKTVLIVDDDETFRCRLQRAFDVRGCGTRSASDGASALVLAKECSTDLAIVDFRMPGMNGIEISQELSRLCGSTLIILFTGYLSGIGTARSVLPRSAEVVSKPADVDQLIAASESARNALPESGLLRGSTRASEPQQNIFGSCVTRATFKMLRRDDFQSNASN